MCRKKYENKNRKVVLTKNGRAMLSLKFAVCDSIKSRFVKKQAASKLLSSLGIKKTLTKIYLVGSLFF